MKQGTDFLDRPSPTVNLELPLRPPPVQPDVGSRGLTGALEEHFDPTFTAILAQKEKQIQQNYRPVIGVHKWFARRPGTVFRNLLLAEYGAGEPLETVFWRAHHFQGVIADPFMGGGTPIFEANRLGFNVIGADINPMAFWIVAQSLAPLDVTKFSQTAKVVIGDVESEVGDFYVTHCELCGRKATVKYFIWVKTQSCPSCGVHSDLFPGYLLAEAVRHPRHVVACRHCGNLNEYDRQPRKGRPKSCAACGGDVYVDGPAKANVTTCMSCGLRFSYPPRDACGPPEHRMWAIEYHCVGCKPTQKGRFFKRPGREDLSRFKKAEKRLAALEGELPIPSDAIPEGDETKRLHRWGYRRFREMFNARQLLGLGLLFRRIALVDDPPIRHALLTVCSDFLRYQNMLGRYDTYALKCQDIFSVHGFPVGLVQCENNLLGIPKVGSGSYRHFVEKYVRAKEYCQHPFETRQTGRHKELVPVGDERLEAQLVERFPSPGLREAWINARSAETISLPPNSVDGVFTDPPYFDNVQYAELMDFCYAWLRLVLGDEFEVFKPTTTRTLEELTGNDTMGRGLDHFTGGLSRIFRHYSLALKQGAPFVFTFHHNDPLAYIPLVVAILDAGLDCTATLPVPGEMSASLHIARTKSSILDSVFVCRKVVVGAQSGKVAKPLQQDIRALERAGLHLTEGDIRCLIAGHVARVAINRLRGQWDERRSLSERMSIASTCLAKIRDKVNVEMLVAGVLKKKTYITEKRHARPKAL